MRVTINQLMDKLGVGYVPGAYESCPWSHYDAEDGVTCSAEIRMGPDGDEVEGEIQTMYDDPPEGTPPMEHVCYLKAAPTSEGQWTIVDLRVKGAPLEEEIYNWEEKSCDFFAAVVQELKTGNIPDIDELIETILHSRERLNDQYGGGGGKSPKIKGSGLTGMKKGGF